MAPDTHTIKIEKLVHGGRGLGRYEGKVVLVPGVLPGETVSVSPARQHRQFEEAVLHAVCEPAPDRVGPPCAIYGRCGGCQLQHMRYAAQLEQKAVILIDTLRRLGKLELPDVPPVVPSPDPYGYRSTLRLSVFRADGRFRLGFHEKGAVSRVETTDCLLAPESMRRVMREVQARLAAVAHLPLRVESLELRRSVAFESILLVYEVGQADAQRAERLFRLCRSIPGVVGQVIASRGTDETDRRARCRFVEGQDWLPDRLGDLLFRISDRSFIQAHWILNERLTATIGDWILEGASREEPPRVLELYAGIGTIGLSLARRGALVTEVEPNPFALADARHAARHNHIGRSRFRAATAETMLEGAEPGAYDVVIVDPPRRGLTGAAMQGLSKSGIRRLLYLSCDLPTLARDLAQLHVAGYRLVRLQAFDMFPQTAHLETLVELRRDES